LIGRSGEIGGRKKRGQIMQIIGGLPVEHHTTSELEEELVFLTDPPGGVPEESDPMFARYWEVVKELESRRKETDPAKQ
jgi:hypothetical protein